MSAYTTEQMLQAALAYVKEGYSVIPVGMNKKPIVKWLEFQERRASEEEIKGWFKQFPNAQIGIVTGAISDLVVIDVEASGDFSMFPETTTVNTGGGGVHLYYKHPGHPVKNGVRVAKLTDIRGDGGYVVAPPSSSTKGQYTWQNSTARENHALYPVDRTIMKPEVLAGIKHTELIPLGKRNDEAAKKTGELIRLLPQDLWEDIVWPELIGWNKTALEIPLDLVELRTVFKSICDKRTSAETTDKFTLKPFTLRELYAENFPPVEWVAKDMIPLGVMAAITGDSNTFKSFLTLSLAQSIATGTPFLGKFDTTQGKVLILDEENTRRTIEKRFKDMQVEEHDNIVFLSLSGIQLDKEAHHKSLLALVNTIKPRLIVLDSLVRLHGKDENSATEMRHVMRALSKLVDTDRTVLFIHHNKKDQGYARKTTSSSVRGSTDIFNALDCHVSAERKADSVIIRMLKLRIQKELEPFKVAVVTDEHKHISFEYQGEDTSIADKIVEIKDSIMEMLYGAAEEVSKKHILDELGSGKHMTNQALKELTEARLIAYRKGPRGKHLYSLPTNTEVIDGITEEVTNPEEIPY